MKAKVIRSFIDKNTMQDIDKGLEIEITQERFLELTEGPRGIFVEEIIEEIKEEKEKVDNLEDSTEEKVKEDTKKKSTKK